jgi:SAM-dependent methyltransferase
MDALHTPVYERLAEAIYARLEPASAIDVGCGTGRLLAAFAKRGVYVRGLEGSRHAIAMSSVSERIIRCNLERGVPYAGQFDLCSCIEVAEHLPARSAQSLVGGLAAMSDVVVFSAAPPGQKGSHHVNLRPQSYWLKAFEEYGFMLSALTSELKAAIEDVRSEATYIQANLMVFTRETGRNRRKRLRGVEDLDRRRQAAPSSAAPPASAPCGTRNGGDRLLQPRTVMGEACGERQGETHAE